MAATERDVCATDGCYRAAVEYFEAGGIGSRYCGDCAANVRAIAQAMTQDKAPEWAVREAEALTGKTTSYSRQVWAIALALSQAYERGQADSRIAFIEWLRPWVKKRFGKWITHNTATGAFNEYQDAIRSLPIEQDSEVKG